MLDRLVEFASCEQPRCVMSLSSSRSMHATVANASNATVAAGSPSQNEEPSANINNDTSDEDDDDPPSAAPNMFVLFAFISSHIKIFLKTGVFLLSLQKQLQKFGLLARNCGS
ncbi:unnamed protein product [Toxocara canis]|uniref:Uncharacterized protein n=1 Tax=Toxocara canis TaxID=6265 RepID=A0A183U956_TOXCA|nr:unnamed protein product [Toxocara canis]